MRLLIVEDEEKLAKNLKRLLEFRGFAVDILDSGERAFTRLSLYRNDYSLALIDLSLPGLDGTTLTKRLREEKVTLPIIIITGRAETQFKIELLNSGADDYVVKPFSSEELVARINSVLRRPLVAQPIVHTVGNLTVDTASRKVSAEGAEIRLTLKEYSLLECFLRRPGEVLTRNELANQVWDFNSVNWSNVLDVHMKNLRKKLSQAERAARFETIRGVGYRLVTS
ncbi:response regulator transcription factor [Candidatus Uhrbacteria bacterium]|nr:response regulator transcription factor [Candidatus Uhrbacteria bacterium]